MLESVVQRTGEEVFEGLAVGVLHIIVIADDDVHRQAKAAIDGAHRVELLGLAVLGQVADDQTQFRLLLVRLDLGDYAFVKRRAVLIQIMQIVEHYEGEILRRRGVSGSQGARPQSGGQQTAGTMLQQPTTRQAVEDVHWSLPARVAGEVITSPYGHYRIGGVSRHRLLTFTSSASPLIDIQVVHVLSVPLSP